jgi:hypothetical protein
LSSTLEAGHRPRIDPRIARRRVEVRREEGRRRLRILVGCCIAGALACLAGGSLWTPLFKVRHLQVTVAATARPVAGLTQLSRHQVVVAAGFAHRRLMVDVDGAALARRLNAIPTLGGAKVSVHWPGTVHIAVSERQAVAAVAAPGPRGTAARWALVDATGRVLAAVAAPPAGLPVVYGASAVPGPGGWLAGSPGPAAPVSPNPGFSVAGSPDMNAASDSPDVPGGMAAALAIATSLPAQVRSEVQSITVANAQAGSQQARPGLYLSVLPSGAPSGAIKVDLGDGSQLDAKLTALTAVLTQSDLSNVTELNLTVPDRPAALTGATNPG